MIKLKTEDYEQMLDRLKVISNVVDKAEPVKPAILIGLVKLYVI